MSIHLPHLSRLLLMMVLGTLAAGVVLLVWFINPPPLLSPLGSQPAILGFGSLIAPDKVVYGFLPYWNFRYHEEIDYQALTHLAMFGLSYEESGAIRRREADYMEPGWRQLNSNTASQIISKAHAAGIKVTLTMTAFDNATMEAILTDQQARTRCIDETLEFMTEQGYDGINLDFEYVGTPTAEIRQAMTVFTKQLATRLKQTDPQAHLSVSVYADSADNNRLWQIDELGQIVDHLVVMTYDFHRPSSQIAGPVAPVFGAGQLWKDDIVTLIAKHMSQNEPGKILLGVPFYGYQWQTKSSEYQSPTVPRTGRTASFRRISEILASDLEVTEGFNATALSPWLSFVDGGRTYQIYYDDLRSLGYKYDLVNQSQLGGVAIWALGYEGPDTQMYQLIKAKFSR